MEVTYKQVTDGIKISTEQAVTIYAMCDLVYKTLAPPRNHVTRTSNCI